MNTQLYLFGLLALLATVQSNPSLVWWQVRGYSPWWQDSSSKKRTYLSSISSPLKSLKGMNLNLYKYFVKKIKDESTPLKQTENTLELWEHGERRVWEQSLKWEQIALTKEKEVTTARVCALYLTVIGAGLQTLGSQIATTGWICSVSGGMFLGLVPIITSKFLNKNSVADRANSRLIAELLQSEVHKSLAKVEPYGNHIRRGFNLKEMAHRITESLMSDDLSNQLLGINNENEEIPRVPDDSDYKTWYIEKRLDHAIALKRSDAAIKLRHSRGFKVIQFTLSTAGGLIGIVGGAMSGSGARAEIVNIIQGRLGVWVSVIAAASAAISAHLQSTKLDEEATRLVYTIRRLEEHEEWRSVELLQRGKRKKETSLEWNNFVNYCETLLNCQSLPWGSIINCTSCGN
jgi:hypothetical protein